VNEGMRTRDLLRADLMRVRSVLGRPPRSGMWVWLGVISPRMLPVLLVRLASLATRARMAPLGRAISALNCAVFGIEVALRCRIGPGLYLPHTYGTVIGAIEIGANASIYQGVTLGARDLDITFAPSHRPSIGDDVILGAGSVVLGGVRIGNGVVVGANAVVMSDVPPGCLAVGVPARIIDRKRVGSVRP
jgi:serine O-acetyltransferase